MGLVNMEHTRTMKNSRRSRVDVRDDFRPRKSITRVGIYNRNKAIFEACLNSLVGDWGSQLKFPGISSRAKKPVTD